MSSRSLEWAPGRLEVIKQIARFHRGNRNPTVAFDLMNTGKTNAGFKVLRGQVSPVAGQNCWRIGFEKDSAFSAFEMTATIVVKVNPIRIQHFKKERPRRRGELAKLLDLNPAFA